MYKMFIDSAKGLWSDGYNNYYVDVDVYPITSSGTLSDNGTLFSQLKGFLPVASNLFLYDKGSITKLAGVYVGFNGNIKLVNATVNSSNVITLSLDSGNTKVVVSTEGGGGGDPYVLPTASSSVLGGIKVGSNLSIDENGVLSGSAPTPPYSLPTASDSVLGGIKVGSNLNIDENGVLSASGGGGGGVDLTFTPIAGHVYNNKQFGYENDIAIKLCLSGVLGHDVDGDGSVLSYYRNAVQSGKSIIIGEYISSGTYYISCGMYQFNYSNNSDPGYNAIIVGSMRGTSPSGGGVVGQYALRIKQNNAASGTVFELISHVPM